MIKELPIKIIISSKETGDPLNSEVSGIYLQADTVMIRLWQKETGYEKAEKILRNFIDTIKQK